MESTIFRIAILTALSAIAAFAHCDSLDGPVVGAARKALDTGNVDIVLPWVKPDSEPAIRKAFARTVAVRKLSPEAKALSETWFFETLVRIHRAGEGAPYTGLKPAGSELDPFVAAADKALLSGSQDDLVQTLTLRAKQGLQHRFHRAIEARDYKPSDIMAGRQYVAAYVDYIHFAEKLGAVLTADQHEH